MTTMKVEIVNVETIKPSCPTPVHLKTYNISFLDQFAPPIYTPLVFIYRNNNADHATDDRYDHFSQTLKNSLSATLTLFPPLAGKIKDNVSVDCNDDGVQCYETRVHSTLDQLLLQPDLEFLHRLTVGNGEANVLTDGQLFVKINLFDCGGVALGVSISHKLCDAASFTTFFKSWSAKALNSIGQVIVPNLTTSTVLPPRKDFFNIGETKALPSDRLAQPTNELIATRLVFDGPKIDALKAKSASKSTPHPTRVEAVTALIAKCTMAASKTNSKTYSSMSSSSYMFIHTINIRKMLAPSLPETTFGNVFGKYEAYYSEQEDGEACLDMLVDKFRKARMDYSDSLALKNAEKIMDEIVESLNISIDMIQSGAAEVCVFSSWCRMGLYEADFGMGKPIWVGLPAAPAKNVVVLLDTKDGNGIEAYLALTEKDMAVFQADSLLLQYASVNPAVLV